MPTNILVPRLGEGVDEVTVSRWLKKVGDHVDELEALLEVNTDKVDTEIPSPADGVLLQALVEEGQIAKVGTLLAVVGSQSEMVVNHSDPGPAFEPLSTLNSTDTPQTHSIVEKTASTSIGFISPVVSKLAAEHGIDLHFVRGTGLGGRVTKNDVLAYVENRKITPAAAQPEKTSPPNEEVRHQIASSPGSSSAETKSGDRLIKHSLMRKSIAEHMVASKHISPHVLTVMEADMSRVVAHRAANKEAFARDGAHLTYTAYFMCALVAGLKAHSLANASWSDEGVIAHGAINIGMATSLGSDGLIVPVIKDADTLSLLGMTRTINDLANRARARKLLPDEVRGGTFTLTNHGTGSSLFAMPIINQPQCGILGIGAMQKRAVVVSDSLGNDAIAIRSVVYLSFVFDHRILDGASADAFLYEVKNNLENWSK